MSKVLVIAHREFTSMVGTKAFVFTMVMMPILMLGGMVVLPIIGKIGGVKTRQIVVADSTGQLFTMIEKASEKRTAAIQEATNSQNESNVDRDPIAGTEFFNFRKAESTSLNDNDRLRLSEQIRNGELYAFVELPADMIDSGDPVEAIFVSQDAAISQARRWMEGVLREKLRVARLTEMGIDPVLVDSADVAFELEPSSPYRSSEDGSVETKGGAQSMAAIFVPFGIMMLMFVVIFMAAQPMLESAMEEKQHRIAELLLGSVNPRQLMAGKLLGNVAGSLVIFAVYAVGGLFVAQRNGWDIPIEWNQMPWFLIFQVLGVLLFSSVFLTIGASVSELKEAQSLLMPVWIMLMIPMMLWLVAVRDPNGPVATTLSFFPPSTPLMMTLRIASGQTIPVWQPPAAALLMVFATYVVVSIAARIYRASLLKSDSAASFAKMFQRLRAAE